MQILPWSGAALPAEHSASIGGLPCHPVELKRLRRLNLGVHRRVVFHRLFGRLGFRCFEGLVAGIADWQTIVLTPEER